MSSPLDGYTAGLMIEKGICAPLASHFHLIGTVASNINSTDQQLVVPIPGGNETLTFPNDDYRLVAVGHDELISTQSDTFQHCISSRCPQL